jgi:hypothetical protein
MFFYGERFTSPFFSLLFIATSNVHAQWEMDLACSAARLRGLLAFNPSKTPLLPLTACLTVTWYVFFVSYLINSFFLKCRQTGNSLEVTTTGDYALHLLLTMSTSTTSSTLPSSSCMLPVPSTYLFAR